ncbi:VOC family protein [Undibacterium sp. LX40W]|uniref:VOC family protein n=1 Tax=Undibacterium nitidum TaxID=2762298 RepID=A0A923HTD5_9BURK|nr:MULTISPECIES: VOC family protein [Undibacterium]MBC3882217.1 VOC family protein [Undibacterium nitidum]MBC3892498.1 VOC family protein [Undibacterium sp. LX40W]
MKQTLGLITLVVRDYDEALLFYVEKLGFVLIEDSFIAEQNKRWVVVAPAGSEAASTTKLLLARASNSTQAERVGDQTGGRVMGFLHTDNFQRDFESYQRKGVEFVRGPNQAPYGMVAVFKDLYGNLWDLIGPADASSP